MQKKRFGALLLALVLIFTLALPAAAAAPALTAAETARQAGTLAAQYGQASALQYAVWVDGKITLQGGTGVYSKSENRALTEDLLYGVGSVSKIYTTAAVMQLAQAGKISLDAPVTRYLPDFKMADPRYTQITVRMLLNHSSGLMGGSTNDAFLFADTDQSATTELLTRLSTQRLKAAPGAFSVYCNDGFTLAQLVVEAVSGQDFAAYLHGHILTPAGLSSTFVPRDSFDTKRLVKTYATPDSPRPLARETLGIVGCGGIYASASDLAAFGGALTNGSILSASSLKQTANAEYKRGLWPEDDTDSVAYGLGWDSVKYYPFATSGIQALAKGGDTLYYHAGLVVIPEYKMAAAVLSSGGVSTYNEMAAAQMLAAVLTEKGVALNQNPPAIPTAKPGQMPKSVMDASGYYVNLAQQLKVTVTSDGKLTLHFVNDPNLPDQVYAYFDDGSFRDATGQAVIIRLVTEKNGETYFYQKGVAPVPGLGYAVSSQYVAQKLPANEIPPALQADWDQFAKLPFLPVNMKYTSQVYLALASAAPGAAPETIPGYITGLKILNETTAQSFGQIPNTAGRDSQFLTRYTENGRAFYTHTQGTIYRDCSDLSAVYCAGRALCTIGADGYARWYSVAPQDVGKKMTVTQVGEGGFFAYDAAGQVTASTAAYGDTAATLSKDGMLVFAGDPGTRFTLTFTK